MQEQRAQALDRQQGRETDSHVRPDEYGANDSRIFTAAAAVALGYVAARGLPPYAALSSHSEEHLGPVPPASVEQEEPHLQSAPVPGIRDWQNGMRAVGSKLARAAGPVLGDDEVEANMSPVSAAELSEDILQGLRAAGESHPRSIEELLNVERHPDEESEVAFEQDYTAELEKDSELEL